MSFMIQKYNKILHQYCVVNGVFTKEEVEMILDLEDLQKFSKGKVGMGPDGSVNEETRNSDIMWIELDDSSMWLFDKFGKLVSDVNGDFFMYNVHGFDSFQYTVYRESNHYTWHIDMGNMSTNFERKISATIALTDPSEYEGGDLEIVPNGNVDSPVVIRPNIGDVIFFASWMPHRVTPVTSGVRKSLVSWVMGERTW